MFGSDDNRCVMLANGAVRAELVFGAMSGNEVARSKTRGAVRPHQSAAPRQSRQSRHACPPLPWPPPSETVRRPLWPPGWDR